MTNKSFDQRRHSCVNYRAMKSMLQTVRENDDYMKFESPGFMPLSVEYLGYSDHAGRPVYSMMHYYTQNGDLMRDPDMTFSVDEENGYIVPLTYQQDNLAVYQEVFKRNHAGKLFYSERLIVELDEFLWMWLKNLHSQGFPVD